MTVHDRMTKGIPFKEDDEVWIKGRSHSIGGIYKSYAGVWMFSFNDIAVPVEHCLWCRVSTPRWNKAGRILKTWGGVRNIAY